MRSCPLPSGAAMPVFGIGTWRMGESTRRRAQELDAIRFALELGYPMIDTAEMYGDGVAEEIVGEAIARSAKRPFLVSKVYPHNASRSGTIAACERSLKRLRTDYLDLYMLHWSGRHPIAETMRAMAKLIEKGSILFAGVSNLDVDELPAAVQAQRIACDQVLYHLGDRGMERRVLPYCAERRIPVVAYSPFGQRRFPERSEVLQAIAKRHGKTPRQVALNFLTRHPAVFAIPKAANVEHVRENSGGAGWDLAPEDVAAIDRAFPAPDRDVPLGML